MARRGFHDWREWRRFQALGLARRGWKHCDIAEALGISEGAVSQWLAHVRDQGTMGLRARPHAGHPKLSRAQKRLIPDFLWHGAEAYGFRGELWTCARIVKVIERELGVRYHRHHLSRMLKRLGWTPQMPITRAIQRDEKEIARWRTHVWPRLQQRAHQERRTLVFTDESGLYLLPGVVRTYGPKGETPVIQEWQTRDHLSVMGAVTSHGKLHTLIRQDPFNGLHCVAFLKQLLRHATSGLLVIWDRSPIHRRSTVQKFVASVGEAKLAVEFLPIYAPDLNPVEWLWKHLKGVELCNQACLDLEELHSELHLAIDRVRRNLSLVASFFEGAGLAFTEL